MLCMDVNNLPTINEKHVAVICLAIISVFSAWMLKADAVPIITACVGSIGGFIAGRGMK